MPSGHPLPHSVWGHVDPGESEPGSLPLIQEASFEAGPPALVPGGSGVGQDLLPPMPVDPPPFLQPGPVRMMRSQVRAYLYLPSPEASSLCQLMGVERVQGSVYPASSHLLSHGHLWLRLSVRKPSAGL
ncbi:hypothetical protein E2C01_055569 [Portunus trituberculatus]|uniref:Uncharacterized protein n=1 Tax=Portunus trituberculatus TaxID=210409 RepID=A0A5B7GV52_PORTR|nr:hypothetical protein [Portunus trituberculatus]